MFWNKPRPKNHPLGVKKGRKSFNPRLFFYLVSFLGDEEPVFGTWFSWKRLQIVMFKYPAVCWNILFTINKSLFSFKSPKIPFIGFAITPVINIFLRTFFFVYKAILSLKLPYKVILGCGEIWRVFWYSLIIFSDYLFICFWKVILSHLGSYQAFLEFG